MTTWPTVPPANNRTDTTAMVTNHKNDHNTLANNISDIVDKIGNNPSSYSTFPTVEDRFTAYDRANTILIAHATSADSWKEAADVVLTADHGSDATTCDNDTSTVNGYALKLAQTSSTSLGGGKILFAPTRGGHYNFGPTSPIALYGSMSLEFIGGKGYNAAFGLGGNDDPTDVQAYFQAGVLFYFSDKASLMFHSGTYLFGNQINIFGNRIYVGSNGTAPEQVTLKMHPTGTFSTGLISIVGTSASAMYEKFNIDSIKIDGSGLGFPGLYAQFAKLIYGRKLFVYNTGSAANAKGSGMYFDGSYDCFFDECRLDWCGSKNNSAIGSSNVRGAIHITSNSQPSNNIHFSNTTIETVGDCAVWIEKGTGSNNTNKLYWNKIKIEDSIRTNHPLIYMNGVDLATFTDIDITSGNNLSGVTVAATPQWEIVNTSALVINGLNMEPTANTITGAVATGGTTSATLTMPANTVITPYNSWKVAFYNGATLLGSRQITSVGPSAGQIGWSGSLTVSTGNTYYVYEDSIESFIRLNGGNKDIVLANLRGTAQSYRYPTVAYVNLNSSSDSGVSFSGVADLYYDGSASPTEKPSQNPITLIGGTGVGPTSAFGFDGKAYNSKMRYLSKATLATGSQYSGSQVPFEGANFVTISDSGVVTDSAAMSIQQKPTFNANMNGVSAAIKATNKAYGSTANAAENVGIVSETGYEGTATPIAKTYGIWTKINAPTVSGKAITDAVGVQIEPVSGGAGTISNLIGLRISGYNGLGTQKWAYQFADNSSYSRNQGSVGIGGTSLTQAPNARLHVTEPTIGLNNEIIRLESESGLGNPIEKKLHYKTTTTSASATIATIPIPLNTACFVEIIINCKRSDNAAATFKYWRHAPTTTGSLGTLVTVPSDQGVGIYTTGNITFSVSGNNIVVATTAVSTLSTTWTTFVKILAG